MEDKRIIAHKNERIKNIAFNLRTLFKKEVMKRWTQLGEAGRNNERNALYRALEASICECSSCYQTNREMIYNAPLKEWYCTLCVQKYRDYYHKKKAILDQGGFVGDFNEDFHKTFL